MSNLLSTQLKSGADLEDVWKEDEGLTQKSGSKLLYFIPSSP